MRNREFWCQTAGSVALISAALFLGGVAITGCGSPESNSSGDNKSSDATNVGKSTIASNNETAAPNDPNLPAGVHTDKNGVKRFHKIPYDIFYQDPLAVGQDQRPIGVATPPKVDPGGKKKPPANNGGTTVKTPSGDWKSLASGTILDAEVKRIRNLITQKMQTVGRYNGGYKEIQFNAAALAAVAHIIASHPDDVTWKKDALYVRDLGTKMSESAIGLSKKNYDMTKAPFENFVDILNRNKPAGLKEPDKDAEFFDFAERAGLMKRMNSSFNWLKTEVTAEDKFKAEAEQVTHEATIFGVLVKVVGDKSYDRADEEEYQAHVNESVKASQDIVKAVKANDYKSFRAAIDVIGNRCTQCHTEYKE